MSFHDRKVIYGFAGSLVILIGTLGLLSFVVIYTYVHRYEHTPGIATDPHQVTHEYIIDEISHQTNIRTKEESTTATYGSPDESVLVSADMSGYHTIKKIIIVEEK